MLGNIEKYIHIAFAVLRKRRLSKGCLPWFTQSTQPLLISAYSVILSTPSESDTTPTLQTIVPVLCFRSVCLHIHISISSRYHNHVASSHFPSSHPHDALHHLFHASGPASSSPELGFSICNAQHSRPEQPCSIYVLDSSAWLTEILEEVIFDVISLTISVVFTDGHMEDWPLMDHTCVDALEDVQNIVHPAIWCLTATPHQHHHRPLLPLYSRNQQSIRRNNHY